MTVTLTATIMNESLKFKWSAAHALNGPTDESSSVKQLALLDFYKVNPKKGWRGFGLIAMVLNRGMNAGELSPIARDSLVAGGGITRGRRP